jgi:hypothetical protein
MDAGGDWRLTGQENVLRGAELVLKRYRVHREEWEHDHCAFCWAKFVDPDRSPETGRLVDEQPDLLTQGYTTTASHPDGAGYHWVCPTCFDDFRERFGWRLEAAG